jgi:predicted transcriptional regulator YheO
LLNDLKNYGKLKFGHLWWGATKRRKRLRGVENLAKQRPAESLAKDQSTLCSVLIKISQALAETLGSCCEVVVHDLRNPTSSIVHIDNGHVTHRQVGDGIRDLATILRSDRFEDDMLANYLTRTSDGKVLKSMTVVIRNEQRQITGAFCVNFDLGKFLSAKAIIEEFTQGHELESDHTETSIQDVNVAGILRHIIRKTIEEAGRPVSEMSRENKVRIVEFLEDREVFLIRGAVDYVANMLNVSRYTIYNYLDEVRSRRARA